jgi:hypothetical protein
VFVVTTLVVGTSCSESDQTTKVVTTSPDADFLSSLSQGEGASIRGLFHDVGQESLQPVGDGVRA